LGGEVDVKGGKAGKLRSETKEPAGQTKERRHIVSSAQ